MFTHRGYITTFVVLLAIIVAVISLVAYGLFLLGSNEVHHERKFDLLGGVLRHYRDTGR